MYSDFVQFLIYSFFLCVTTFFPFLRQLICIFGVLSHASYPENDYFVFSSLMVNVPALMYLQVCSLHYLWDCL